MRGIAISRVRARPPKRSRLALWIASGFAVFFGVIALSVFTTVMAVATGLTFISQAEAELPSVASFEELDFAEPSVVYDRTGTIELARFQVERRRVVDFEEIPKVLLDATIAVEDRSFWENEGYDPNAIASAFLESVTGVRDRGASTITQQFVRARLLPQDVLEGDLMERKVKEILQARNLTRRLPRRRGQAAHPDRLSEPDLLRPPGVRRRRRGRGLLRRHRPQAADARAGRAARRPAPGARYIRPLQVGRARPVRTARRSGALHRRRAAARAGRAPQLHPGRARTRATATSSA